MAFLGTTKEVARKLKAKHAKGKPGRKKRTTVETVVGKDMAALVKEAEKNVSSGNWFYFSVPGDAIAGKVISYGEKDGTYGPQLVVVVETVKGPMQFSCTSSLREMLEGAGMKKGSKIAVVFQRSSPGKKGNPFKVFGVSVK